MFGMADKRRVDWRNERRIINILDDLVNFFEIRFSVFNVDFGIGILEKFSVGFDGEADFGAIKSKSGCLSDFRRSPKRSPCLQTERENARAHRRR